MSFFDSYLCIDHSTAKVEESDSNCFSLLGWYGSFPNSKCAFLTIFWATVQEISEQNLLIQGSVMEEVDREAAMAKLV